MIPIFIVYFFSHIISFFVYFFIFAIAETLPNSYLKPIRE
jgi:hypothetical protein